MAVVRMAVVVHGSCPLWQLSVMAVVRMAVVRMAIVLEPRTTTGDIRLSNSIATDGCRQQLCKESGY